MLVGDGGEFVLFLFALSFWVNRVGGVYALQCLPHEMERAFQAPRLSARGIRRCTAV